MATLVWDAVGSRIGETGTSKGVYYPLDQTGKYSPGVAWNGLRSVTNSNEGAEPQDFYADDQKYITLRSAENFSGSIGAYTYPSEFAEAIGEVELVTGANLTQQPRKTFGFCYRTAIVNDVSGDAYGYKLHLVYGATAGVSESAYETINDTPTLIEFSWDFTTVPVAVTGHRPTAHLIVDSTKVATGKMAALEAKLYGDADTTAELPLPDAVVALLTTGD